MVDIGDLTKAFYVISVPNIGFTISSLPGLFHNPTNKEVRALSSSGVT